eukprot:CAMPEP_0113533402 /NCGR_PEP_ID=MMETSP0015_2-20120614/4587_1 /TAXON_ID=2838 /ORGANISM="Odontella" /LENGTH=1177 /DNA_ID=CAMNT_0000432455 /DNA_START=202 /DNA_END=3735 /DNA_ORIENTATION=- /assembly_acc=CAM_ASM_000160
MSSSSEDPGAVASSSTTANGPSKLRAGRPALAAVPLPKAQRRRGALGSLVGGMSKRRLLGGLGPSSQLLGVSAGSAHIPEEEPLGDHLHHLFRTCGSISEIRESLYLELEEGRGESVFLASDEWGGRLLLHCIGLNKNLIVDSPGGQALAEDFILNELLPAYPAAIIEEDDDGRSPFMEVIVDWIEERRAARRRSGTGAGKKGLADMVQDAARVFFYARDLSPGADANGDAEEDDAKAERYEVPPLVEWSLKMLSSIVGRPPTPSSFRKRRESKAEHSPEKQRRKISSSIVEASYDSLFVIDQEGTIEMVNEASVKEFGWTEEDFLGSNISMICGGGHGPRHHTYLKRYLETGEKRVMGVKGRKLFARRKDGSEFPIELGITETGGGKGQGRKFCGFVRHRMAEEVHYGSDSSLETEPVTRRSLGASLLHPATGDSLSDVSFMSDHMTPSKLEMDPFQSAVHDELVVENLASIPHLVEELLLIEDTVARERIFDLPIVRKVLLCPDSFGDDKWLMNLLTSGVRSGSMGLQTSRRRSDISDCEDANNGVALSTVECAVFYLERISHLSRQDDVTDHSTTRPTVDGTTVSFREKRNILFDRIGKLEGLIRILCALEGEMLKRAAVTRAIQRMLDRTIFSPFALSEALSDGLCHMLFICAFRTGPAEAMFHLSPADSTFKPQQYLTAMVILVGCVVYFSMKGVHLSLAKRASTPELFWRQITNPMNATGLLTMIMVTYCMIAVDLTLRRRALGIDEESEIPFRLRVAVAMTTPMLWLRILGHIKMFNKQLATFILCSFEILNDIKWFLLVLLIAISSFAQMMVSLTFEPLSHSEPNLEYQYFSLEGYLKAYTIMLGDIDFAALQKHSSIVVLFILYTFGVTVVLLNILIAIVSESYVNAVYASSVMLGKARVMFVADILSMKMFHSWKCDGNIRWGIDSVFFAFACLCTRMVLLTVKAKLASHQGPIFEGHVGLAAINFEGCALLFFVTGAIAIQRLGTIYLLNSIDKGDSGKETTCESRMSKYLGRLSLSLRAAFSRNIDILTEEDDVDEEDAAQTESAKLAATSADQKVHRAVNACRKELKAEVKRSSEKLRHALQQSEDKSQRNIIHCEDNLTSILSETQEWVASALAASEERIIRTIVLKLEEKRAKENEQVQEKQQECSEPTVLFSELTTVVSEN